ncbi:MAG: DUF4199 domain-containing protein [Paludibacter sp.]|nr:DUF4199 domain-containing protein [Paludibacter sp.]
MQQNIKNSARLNGLIVGVMLSLKFVLSAQKYDVLASFSLFISILIVFVLYRMSARFRDTKCEGTISYKHAFSYIFQVYVYGSIISSFVILLYTSFVDTNYLGSMLDVILKLYEKINMRFDDKTYKVFETMYKPAPFAILNIISSLFVGAFWGLILAAFLKKEKSVFED